MERAHEADGVRQTREADIPGRHMREMQSKRRKRGSGGVGREAAVHVSKTNCQLWQAKTLPYLVTSDEAGGSVGAWIHTP